MDGVTHIYRYVYDLIGQLTDVYRDGSLVSHYEYDSNGNRVGGTCDDQDRMLQYGGNTYQYSANGELQQKTDSNGSTKYDYDVLGNLRAVELTDSTKIEYVIDGANRRIGKKVNGTLVQGFLYQDGLNPVAELDASGNVVARFVYGTRANVPDYMVKGGITYRIISDHLGSVRFVVNASTGDIVQKMEYDEFGRVIIDTNPGFTPFGFAGGIYDKDTGLVRFGARDYDAEIGRWTCKDPIGFKGGDSNVYLYCGNEPLKNIDPNGYEYLDPNIYYKVYYDNTVGRIVVIYDATVNSVIEKGRNLKNNFNNYWEKEVQPTIKSIIYHDYYTEYHAGRGIIEINDLLSNGELEMSPELKFLSNFLSFIDSLGKPITPEEFENDLKNNKRKTSCPVK